MLYAVRGTHREIPEYLSWGLEREIIVFDFATGAPGKAPYTSTSRIEDRTLWADRAGAEKACAWLTRDARRPMHTGHNYEIVEVEE